MSEADKTRTLRELELQFLDGSVLVTLDGSLVLVEALHDLIERAMLNCEQVTGIPVTRTILPLKRVRQ
jgi:hypothetical protein